MSAKLEAQIGQRLRRIRRMRNLTQKELANKTVGKLDYTYIGKIERGVQLPSLKVLRKLSEALALPLAYFFQDEALTHLLPEELRRLSREGDRRALLLEVAKISRGDIPLLLEIIRVLDAHRRMKRGQWDAVPYRLEQKEVLRAADWAGRYRKRQAGTESAMLLEAIGALEQLVKKANRSRQPASQRAVQALQRACRELKRGVTSSS
ncbi:MAG: transcriptional regulator, family [candidate division NC10 bacterium]|nr:transcriptional regulator, family [candidate division NC10 bacterium]